MSGSTIGNDLFTPGRVVATPGALALMEAAAIEPRSLLFRHLTGDFGAVGKMADIPPGKTYQNYDEDEDGEDMHDLLANAAALEDGSRIMSVYALGTAGVIWIITDAAQTETPTAREVTTFLLPSDY